MSVLFDNKLIKEATSILASDPELSKLCNSGKLEEAKIMLDTRASDGSVSFGGPKRNYWSALESEMYLLLCKKNNKYNTTRKRIKECQNTTQTLVIPMIAGAIGQTIGLTEAILIPFVALFMFSALKLGVNAWCKIIEEGNSA